MTITFCAERLPSGGTIRPIPIDFDKSPHVICQGSTGTGKSIASLLMTAKISRIQGSQVFILDYKNDVDTFRFCHSPNCRYWRFQDCEDGLEEYYNLLQSELASEEDIDSRPIRWLWIDELGSWLLNSDKKKAESVRAKIATVLMLGRSRRFFCLTSVQRAQAELFSQGSRDNYSVCLGMGNLTKESASVLGFSREKFLPVTEIGGGHLIVGGQQYPVQIPYIGPCGMAKMKEDILRAVTRTDCKNTERRQYSVSF